MNLIVPIGHDFGDKEVFLNFSEVRLILLLGMTGSGKSVFHNLLYSSLMKQNTPEEIGFIFLDMTRIDFVDWDSSYLIAPTEVDIDRGRSLLEKLSQETAGDKKIFVHIEESSMFEAFPDEMMIIIQDIIKKRPDVTLIYSTSRVGATTIKEELLNLTDAKVVFTLASIESLEYVLGEGRIMPGQWEKIIAVKNSETLLKSS